jgi:hypothetical protein
VVGLQEALLQSRVVYCSATGITLPKHMGYLSRLGLWGAGTQYLEFKHFVDTIKSRPLGARELVVRLVSSFLESFLS